MKRFRPALDEIRIYSEYGLVSPGFRWPPELRLTSRRVVVIVCTARDDTGIAIYDIPRANAVVPTAVYGDMVVIASNDPATAAFAFRSGNPRELIAQLAEWIATTPPEPLPTARVVVHD